MSSKITLLLGVLVLVAASGPARADTHHVDADASGANDGTSWADAFVELQDALAAAAPGDDVWVAASSQTYRPDYDPQTAQHTGDRAATFLLESGVRIYGGFAGTETSLTDRAGFFDETIVSGDLLGDDETGGSTAENSYNVLSAYDVASSAVLDGFTITAGRANGGPNDNDRAGGMYNRSSSPVIMNCTFVRNFAQGAGGGGMFNTLSSAPTIVNCRFLENTGWGVGGGGMRNIASSPVVINCLFADNVASYAGAIFNDGSTCMPVFINCTIRGNSASFGAAGIYSQGDAVPTITNSILWGNSRAGSMNEAAQITSASGAPILNDCCVQGWTGDLGGVGNLGDDPLFVGADDARLQDGSPCVDTGDDMALPADEFDVDMDGDVLEQLPFDLDHGQRVSDGDADGTAAIDIGAFEREPLPCPGDCADTDGVVATPDLLALLAQWGTPGGCDADGNGVVATPDLLALLAAWGACD